MPDPIFTAGPLPTPLAYKVPGTDEVTPISCQALFDGSGASGSFLPTLLFVSQAGHVIARMPVSTPVAAGASAEVSWFPGGELEASGGGGGTAFASVYSNNTQTVPAGEVDTITWDWTKFTSTDPTIFTADAANEQIVVAATGLVIQWVSMLPNSQFILNKQTVGCARADVQSGVAGATVYGFDLGPPVYVDQLQSYNFMLTNGGFSAPATFGNFDVNPVDIASRLMMIALLSPQPAGSLASWPVF